MIHKSVKASSAITKNTTIYNRGRPAHEQNTISYPLTGPRRQQTEMISKTTNIVGNIKIYLNIKSEKQTMLLSLKCYKLFNKRLL